MKYLDFKNIYSKLPYFSSNNLDNVGASIQSTRKQLNDWHKKGLIVQLRRGLYAFNSNDRKFPLQREIVSNILVEPSYVSLEYALAYYGLIPERVNTITAVTPKKTKTFNNETGLYIYRNIKKDAFGGFIEEKTKEGYSFFIATQEKALLDFLYFNMVNIDFNNLFGFCDSYRMQNLEIIDMKRVFKYAEMYNSKKLLKIVNILEQYINRLEYSPL